MKVINLRQPCAGTPNPLSARLAIHLIALSIAIGIPAVVNAGAAERPELSEQSALEIFRSLEFDVRKEVYPGDPDKVSQCAELKDRVITTGESMKTLALQGTPEFEAHRQGILKQCPAIDIEKPVRVRMPHASSALGTDDYAKLAAHFGRQLESEFPVEVLESPWMCENRQRVLIKMLAPVDVTFDKPDAMNATLFGMIDTKNCFLHSLPVAYAGYPSVAENNWAEIVELDGHAGVLAVSYSEPLRTFRATFRGVDPNGRMEAPVCSFHTTTYEER